MKELDKMPILEEQSERVGSAPSSVIFMSCFASAGRKVNYHWTYVIVTSSCIRIKVTAVTVITTEASC